MEDVSASPLRRSRRVQATIPIKVMLEEGRSKIGHDARTVDLSDMGARIQVSFTLSAGEVIHIVSWGEFGGTMPSRVVWVQPVAPGESLAGIEFMGATQSQTGAPV